jgi:hypothetical protein
MYVLMSKIKIIASTALALMVLGMVSSATASAAENENGMPFWWARPTGNQGKGTKLSEASLVQFKSSAQEAKLKGKIVGVPVVLKCSLLAKGSIYNNSNEGQVKVVSNFINCSEGTKTPEECKIKVNQVVTKAHLLWKWNGTKAQLVGPGSQRKLGQEPDGLFLGEELENTEPKAESLFTEIIIENGTGKCLATGTFTVKGDTSFYIKPEREGEFAKKFITTFPGPIMQHFQRLTNPKHVGIKIELIFAGNESIFTTESLGEFEGGQEASIYEEET